MKKKVIIIGAGIAGIASAIELAQKGVEVIVIERKSFPGGRMYSMTDIVSGESIDNGQHIMAGAYNNFFGILKTLNTFNQIVFQKSLYVALLDKNGRRTVLDCSKFQGKAGIFYGFFKLSGVSFKSKTSTIKLLRNLLNDNIQIEEMTVSQMLNENHIPSDIINIFWKPFCLAVMNLKITDASAQLLSNVLKRLFQKSNSSSLAFSKSPLLDLISPFEKWILNQGGNIHFKTTVKQLSIIGNKISVKLDNGEEINSDAVISAIPWYSFSKILPENYHDYLFFKTLNDYESSSIISMYLWLNKNISDDFFTGMLGTKSQWVFNRRKICNDKNKNEKYPGHITITISGANEIIDNNPVMLVKECLDEVKNAFQTEVELLEWKVIKEKRATFIASPAIENKRLSQQTPIENLFLAGDWTSTGLPATLEGAAYSGILAADYAINYLNEK